MQTSSDIKGYLVRENVYLVKKGIDEVWSSYINRSPNKSWKGKKVSFGFLFSKKEDRIVYSDENLQKIDTGMVVYINLRLLSGLVNIATAFEIINIDIANKIIEFSYLIRQCIGGKTTPAILPNPKRLHSNFTYQFLQE